MELYGLGEVLGVQGGESDRGSDFHRKYLFVYAGNNTVVVNGTSHGKGGWQDMAQNTTQTVALEPIIGEDPISEIFTFTQQLLDDTINNCLQQRTISIVRTGPATGYYLDLFRSRSNGENKFHDYIYHNIGDELQLTTCSGKTIPTIPNNNYYSTDIGDERKQPGLKWFENVQTAALREAARVRFAMTAEGKYMYAFIPKGVGFEISKAQGPPTVETVKAYLKVKTPVMIIRKNGEAWNQPFIVAYEPSMNDTPSIQSTDNLLFDGKVVGSRVISKVEGKKITDYILALDTMGKIELKEQNISFNGRFGIVRIELQNGKESVTLYIGEGKELKFGTHKLNANKIMQGIKVIG